MRVLDLATVLAKERELMNWYAPYYERSILANSYFYQEERRLFIAWVLRLLSACGADPAALAILNAGCAAGDILELLAAAGCRRLTGLDIAEAMLREAQRRLPSARFVHGAIEHHDFGAERFDVVITTLTLHHMHDPRAFFLLVDRVLNSRGWLFVLDYNAAGWENARWTKPVIHTLAAPLRRLIKWKNRSVLSQQPDLPLLFNPAHRLLSYQDLLGAMPRPEGYTLHRRTRGVFLPAFTHALVRGSALDRFVYRSLEWIDRVAEPFAAGNLQWIAGQRQA